MTDNLSNEPKHRIFRAVNAAELNPAYKRAAEIENQIAEALSFSEDELTARLAIRNARSEHFLRAETLIVLLMTARAENLPEIEGSICLRLARTVENLLRKFLRAKNLSENFTGEAVGDLVGEFFRQILSRAHPSYDFWEVNFYVSLQRLTKSYLRKHEARDSLTKTFSELAGDEGEETGFEENLIKFENFTTQEKLELRQILGRMPDELRLIFVRYHVDEWTQEQIAEFLRISARTVRTRLKTIAEFLKDFRAPGGEK